MEGFEAEPFLKWAGGKRLLVDQIAPRIRAKIARGRYFEPFLGGGAVFFALAPGRARLSDVNAALIDAFSEVRDEPEAVIEVLSLLRHSAAQYYAVRRWRPRDAARRAARFIYLNKTCFNGLYRENLEGEFNVPFGQHGRSLQICDEDQILAASDVLRHAKLRVADFEVSVREATRHDVVYFDPPYTTAHVNNGFVEYNAKVFGWQDQERLAKLALELASAGTHVFVSNADHESIRTLYPPPFRYRRIARWSTIAASRQKRFATTELLIEGP